MSTKTYSAILTSELYYSCSSFKVKGGGVSICRSASFDLANLYYEYQIDVRSVLKSIYQVSNHYTTMEPSSTSHEEARHSTHTYLGNFRVSVEVI